MDPALAGLPGEGAPPYGMTARAGAGLGSHGHPGRLRDVRAALAPCRHLLGAAEDPEVLLDVARRLPPYGDRFEVGVGRVGGRGTRRPHGSDRVPVAEGGVAQAGFPRRPHVDVREELGLLGGEARGQGFLLVFSPCVPPC